VDVPLNAISSKSSCIRLVASLLMGAILVLAFAPFYLWPLAILVPAGLIWLNRDESSLARLFASGWFFGIGYFGCGVYWIYNSLHDFGMAPPLVAGGITGLMAIYLALTPGLVLLFWGFAQRLPGNRGPWLLPPLWFGLEWFKGWFATGMPWLSLGYSQTPSPLAGFAPLVGVYGIGALCIVMAVALNIGLRERRYPMLMLVLAIPLSGWLLQQVEWSAAVAKPIKVTMVQGNIPQELKWRRDQRQNIFNTYWRETSRHWDSDLIIWPETALPGQSDLIESTLLAPMQAAALENGSIIISGLVFTGKERDQIYNSVIQLGGERGLYHKRHLVMFGEYYPMRWLLDLLSGVINIPYSDLSAGPDEQTLMQVNGLQLGVSICWEDVFSRDVLLALPRANLLVNLSNDAWFGNSTAPHQHMQIAQMRSLETERVMMRATNTGITAFIDHKGGVLSVSEQFKTESITELVQGRSGVTPFYYFAKVQWIVSILPFALLLLLALRNPKAGRPG
jgi:apolipoprotein N-acyltransferase